MTLHRVNSQQTQSVSTHNWAGRPRDRVANIEQQRCLIAALLLCCLFVAIGQSQYVEDSIDVGGAWVGSLAYNSREDVVYGASESGVFFAISCDSNKLVKSLPLGGAFAVAYDSIDNKAYCTFGDSLLAVDGVTHTRIKSLPIEGATNPVWDPVSDRVYVSCQSTNKVAVVDCATDSLLKYISVGASPMKMYINTLRRKLYVLNYDNGTVSIVNMTTNQVIKSSFVGGAPNAGYYCRSADKFYSSGGQNECVVISGQSDSITKRITLPGIDYLLSATGNERAGLVYLGTFSGNTDYVATVVAENDSVIATANTGREPWGLACYEPSGLVYCASCLTSEVYVLSQNGAQVLDTLRVGAGPFSFTIVPRHGRLYVSHEGRYVYVLRDTSTAIAESQMPRTGLQGVSVTPNPFNHRVTVAWNSAVKGGDAVRVFAEDGRVVRRNWTSARQSSWVWDGRDDTGKMTTPGVYVVETGAGRQKVIKLGSGSR
jgi:YVTN family beta-propeller protein